MIPDKKLIEQRFAGAAHTYEQHASIQRLVANRLIEMLVHEITEHPKKILEIGCCTGLLTEIIIKRFPYLDLLTASDLVKEFEPFVQKKMASLNGKSQFLVGDIESLKVDKVYDVIISSSTFHWIFDLGTLFDKLKKSLSPDGLFAFSIYGPNNLKEIRELTGIGLPYKDFSSLSIIVKKEFEILSSEQATETLWFKNPLSVIKHIRQTGVNAVGAKVWTRTQLMRFSEEYEQCYAEDLGVPLTYHPIYFILQPKNKVCSNATFT